MNIVKDVSTLARFNFSSDHRITRAKIEIPKRISVGKFLEKERMVKEIVVENIGEAKEYIREKIENDIQKTEQNMQELYNIMKKRLKEAIEKFGKPRREFTTDNKLTKETKNLIRKREQIKAKRKKSWKDQVDLCELKKTIRREIRRDIRDYEEKLTCEIIEESGSTKKLWKEINQGRKLLTSIRNKEGEIEMDRQEIINPVTEFYRQLYGRDQQDGNENKNEMGKKSNMLVEEVEPNVN